MMQWKRFLADRMAKRDEDLVNDAYTPLGHVRAELDRLARQVRQLPTTRGMYYDQARSVKLKDVLALLREAKK